MIARFLLCSSFLLAFDANAIVLQGQPATHANMNFGTQVTKSTTKAKKVLKDVDCKKIGCKDIKKDFFDDGSDDQNLQKKFKIKPSNQDKGPV